MGDFGSNGTCAALVDLTIFAGLPYYAVGIKHCAKLCDRFGSRIGATALATGSGIFTYNHTAVEIAGVGRLVSICEAGVISTANVGRKAYTCTFTCEIISTCGMAQRFDEIGIGFAAETCYAVRADLFFICKDNDGGMFGNLKNNARKEG